MRRPELSEDERRAACEGKDALEPGVARQIAKRMRRNGKPIQPFRCPVCGAWHIGNAPPKPFRSARRRT